MRGVSAPESPRHRARPIVADPSSRRRISRVALTVMGAIMVAELSSATSSIAAWPSARVISVFLVAAPMRCAVRV